MHGRRILWSINNPIVARLKIDLFLFMPVNNRMIHYQKKGETFPVDKLMEVMKASSSVVLVKEDECKGALESFNEDLSNAINASFTRTTLLEKFRTKPVKKLRA